MSTIAPRHLAGKLTIIAASAMGSVVGVGIGAGVLALLITGFGAGGRCAAPAGGGAGPIALGPPGTGALVGASEYGGPGDPSSGHVGASGADLLTHPDSYAELGGYTFATASAMGGLPYMTALRVTWQAHSAIAYKRDFGFGGGPVAGLPRGVDLWWGPAVGRPVP